MILRPFEIEDSLIAMDLCKALHAESSLSYIPFSQERVANLFCRAIAFPEENFFWVADVDGELVGSFYGELQPYFGCEGSLAAEKWVHVLPGKRGTGAATSLVKRFISWAKEKDAYEVMISPSTGIQTERTVRWLETLGFERCGAMTKLRLRN